MNKLLTTIVGAVLGTTMAVGVGVAAANSMSKETIKAEAADAVYYQLDPVAGADNGYATSEAIVCADSTHSTTATWNVTGNVTMLPWRIGGKNLSGVDREVYSTTTFSVTITKIELELGAASSVTINSSSLVVSKNADFSSPTDTVSLGTSIANKTTTIQPSTGKTWESGSYFKFVFNITIGSSNKFIAFNGATFYYDSSSGGGSTTYTVTYDANGGTGTLTDGDSPYDAGDTVTVLDNTFTRTDYEFDHWNTAADDSGADYDPDDTFTINANTTLYAQWTEIPDTTVYSLAYTLSPVAGEDNTYANSETITVNGIDWNVTGNSTLVPWRLGGKSLTGTNRSVYSVDTIDHDIKKVELDIGSMNITSLNNVTLIVASNSSFSSVLDTIVIDSDLTADSTLAFKPTSPLTKWDSGSYYKFNLNITVSGTNNKYVEFSEARFYQEAAASVNEITVQTGNMTGKYKGDGHIQCSAKADGSDTNDVVWTLSTNTTYVANQTSVTGASINSTGKITFTDNVTVYAFATSTITTTTRGYAACTASGLVDAPVFNLITSTDQLYDGMSIVIGATNYSKLMSTTQNTNNRGVVSAFQDGSNAAISTYGDNYQEIIVGIEEMSDGTIVYYFMVDDGYLYASGTGNTSENKYNHLNTEEELDDNGRFVITFDNETHCATMEAQGTNENKYLRFNSSNSLFSCYPENNSVQDASIYAETQTISDTSKVDTFVIKYMKMNSISTSDNSSTANCESNWEAASAAYAQLSASQKEMFVTQSKYANAVARLSNWASANGQTLNTTTGVMSGAVVTPFNVVANDAAITTIIVISLLSFTTIGGYFLLRKKKED